MNGSMALSLEIQQEAEDFISQYAEIERELKEARRDILKKHGLSSEDWKKLKQMATDQLGDGLVEIGGVTVYTVTTPIFIHTNSKPAGELRRIHIKTKEER